ncbi:transcriptional regulator [Pantoea phage PdC23]|uniref:DNA-binding transcriptional regulator n=1 Tax=Pantoea phage PdC23 TaxID=2894356 RepID=A0AAE8YLR3_9CAUD|nr:transcriptional regulator [Pantoea phage PdC23]UGC97764.1 DNA-binding transcriptional regulator [Pantoea phage PdC23]
MKKSEAIALAGSAVNLAKVLGISREAIRLWKEDIPEERYYQLRGLLAERKWKPVKGQKFPAPTE